MAALRPGQREPEPARLRRHQPGAAGPGRAAVELQLPARRLPGHARRRSEEPDRQPQKSAKCRRRGSSDQLDTLQRLNDLHRQQREEDSQLNARIASFELAFRMQARGAGGVRRRPASRRRPSSSTASTTRRPRSSASNACMARRLVERGVRWCRSITPQTAKRSSCQLWDQHGGLQDGTAEQLRGDRPADRRPAEGPEGARPAGRHAGRLGRRVRPHADGRGHRRPRTSSLRLHHVAGRRRRQGRHRPTARPTSSAGTPSRTRSTSTTCTPRSCT